LSEAALRKKIERNQKYAFFQTKFKKKPKKRKRCIFSNKMQKKFLSSKNGQTSEKNVFFSQCKTLQKFFPEFLGRSENF
jgi:hypothetical protein